MAETCFVTYVSASGVIKSSQYGESGSPPAAGAGESVIDVGMVDPLPTKRTHKVDLAGPSLQVRSQGDIDSEENGDQRERYREQIATLEVARQKYAPEGWDTGAIDAKIAELRSAHDALP